MVYDENMKTRTLIAYPQHQRDFMEWEAKRRNLSMATIARELIDHGMQAYKIFHGLNQMLTSNKRPHAKPLPQSDATST